MDNIYLQYIKDIDRYPLLNEEEESIISNIINNSNNESEIRFAIERLVVGNLKLVVKIANELHSAMARFCRVPPSLMDMIEDGNIGLISAAENFDCKKGKFSTYAYKSVRSCIIRRHSNSSNFIKVPNNHYRLIEKLKKVREEHGSFVSDDTIMCKTGINRKQLSNIKLSEESFVSSIEDHNNMDEFDNSNLLDTYVSDESGIQELIENEEQRKYIESKLSNLNEKEQMVIKMHFFDGIPVSSKDMTKTLGVTKQRTHAIYKRALEKLKKMISFDSVKTDTGIKIK